MNLLEKIGITKKPNTKPTMQGLVKVNKGTQISIIEYDLFQFSREEGCKDWTEMINGWLAEGANVDIYFQQVHPFAIPTLRRLQGNNRDISFYDISLIRQKFSIDNWDEGTHRVKSNVMLEELTTFHLTLFQNPNQVWLEGTHKPQSPTMYDCEFIPA